MYAIYKELHPPTGIEHSQYCNFFNSTEKNLVIASSNFLRVYKVSSQTEVPSKSPTNQNDTKPVSKQRLVFQASFELAGNISSMQNIRLPNSSRDSFLLAFNHAKLSLVEYDPECHELKTLSLHHFEEEELKDGHCQQIMNSSVVRVDPEARCAAMLIYGSRLVILPFRRDLLAENTDISENKTPIGASYIIDLRTLDEKVTNVIDIQFLHGYYEPTLVILYEPLPTWAGRIAVRKDSCSLVAISLNLLEKVHPIIWSLSGLPYGCFSVYPVPKPIGGVLVLAVNSLLYLNQSFPPYGVSLNTYTDYTTDFPLKKQEGTRIQLDKAVATFISNDKVVISLKGGELYVLTLLLDSMRAMKGFSLHKAAASVLTTCMTACGEGTLFLGSRLANSLLLKYTEKENKEVSNTPPPESAAKSEICDEPPSKRQKKDNLSDWMASDISALDELDELEVYGRDAGDTDTAAGGATRPTQYSFQVCDSIMNIGPCGQCIMGEPAFLSEEFSNSVDPDLELVTTSGYGKNGAISVLQRSIRPQVVTTFELPGCTDMWTVRGIEEPSGEEKEEKATKEAEDKTKEEDTEKENEEEQVEKVENGHAFLILSRDDSSMILKTGQEIMELDQSGFETQTPTVFAGNVGDNKYIIQVTKISVRLMHGVSLLQEMPLNMGSLVSSCSVADPYVVILFENGKSALVSFHDDSAGRAKLTLSEPEIQETSRVVAMCAYKDVSGLFLTDQHRQSPTVPDTAEHEAEMDDLEPETDRAESEAKPTDASVFSVAATEPTTVDDEDELLYGDTGFSIDIPAFSQGASTSATEPTSAGGDLEGAAGGPGAEPGGKEEREVKPSYWAALATENGELEIYSLPDFKLVFMVKNFVIAPSVLINSLCGEEEQAAKTSQYTVRELLLIGMGYRQSKPFLMARINEDIEIYEVFAHQLERPDDYLKVRFRKINHGLIVREKKSARVARSKKAEMDWEVQEQRFDKVKWLRPFSDVSAYSGVFLCGPYPHWIFMTHRGALRIHPMGIDGFVTCFAPFHNVNCPKGFLYFNRRGEMRICVLPTHVSYDAPWAVRKVTLRCTPHCVAYHVDSKTYCVVTSVSVPNKQTIEVVGDGEKEFKTMERDDNFLWPTIEKYSLQLFSPVSWEPIPNTKQELDEFEIVTCVKHVNLRSEGTLSGLKGYVAVAACINYSEDVTAKGRIMIYDVIEVVPEPGQPLTKNKIKIEYNKEQKGPVTALDCVEGFLVTAIGQKIYIWQLKDQDLKGIAFIDTQVYTHQMSVIKNLILLADVTKSISLLRYQTDLKVLSIVSRDMRALEVYGIAYMVDNTSLLFLAADRLNNLVVFTYQSEVRESVGGQRLIRRADFHLGHKVNTFFRAKCRLTDPSSMRRAVGPIEKRHVTFFATLDGSIGFLHPVTEKMYRRLLMLQNALVNYLPHVAGLNPKAFRTLQQEYRNLLTPQRNVLDGQLLWRFLDLSVKERIELASRIGTSNDQLVEDFMEIDRTSAHF